MIRLSPMMPSRTGAMFPDPNSPTPPPVPYPVQPPLPIPPPTPPRVWTALLLPILSILAAIFLGGMVAAFAVLALDGFGELGDPAAFAQSITKLVANPFGVIILVLPGQLTFMGAAFGAAVLSPIPLRERLRYNRSALPWCTIPILAISTFFFGTLGGLAIDYFFPGPHEQLELFLQMARSSSGPIAILNIAVLSALPGFS